MKKTVLSMIMVTAFTVIASAQKYGETPEDSVTCIKNLSLYSEFYKQKDYKSAVKPWRWVFLNCPKASQNTYVRGARLVRWMINNEKDPAVRTKLVDTLMMVYDKRIEYFNRKGYVLGRKGCDLYNADKDRYFEAYEILKESISLRGNKSNNDVLVFFVNTSLKSLSDQKIGMEQMLEDFDRAVAIAEYNIKNNPKEKADYEKALEVTENMVTPFISCDNLIPIYRKKFDNNPEDLALLEKITDLLSEKECTDDPLFFEATKKLHALSPSAATAYKMGQMCADKEQYQEASEYLKEAVELYEEDNDKAKSYLLLGDMYRKTGQLSNAREAFRNVIALDPEDPKPYIFIGDLYSTSADKCKGGKNNTLQVAHWAAYDKYAKAKSMSEGELAEVAQEKMNSSFARFPTTEEVFFQNLEKGDTFTVECWINETTVVRVRD